MDSKKQEGDCYESTNTNILQAQDLSKPPRYQQQAQRRFAGCNDRGRAGSCRRSSRPTNQAELVNGKAIHSCVVVGGPP
jgi:hypothetical protein